MIYPKFLAFLLIVLLMVPAFALAQEEQEEEEELLQARPNPFARGSQSMKFMVNAFGQLSGKSMKSLKAGRKLRLTAKHDLNLRSA